ncbi:uncharacterized protein LOC132803112 [Ziziphus jujuba]|uniref:Uncharacterized protein LOC132803112 n=1 Tax=Ziziphus jujuba TaxID=326968 RepID=A0ABM4A3P3_ZIZJJ|nr:uncharacterized protein LOC132803112 [Ziziphus jujuba]
MKLKKGVRGIVGIKIDLQKAYDRVDWVVLTRILTLFGFSDKFTKLVLNCMSSMNMELLLNASVFGQILMGRRLRQGDLISSFLFIILMELLSKMLLKWERDGKINGVKLGRQASSIIHLLFADDLLIFCRANMDEVKNVYQCLQLFYKWIGQAFNKEKSGCFFFKNVTPRSRLDIKWCLGMKELDNKSKHLGLPLFIERNKSTVFEDLRRKVEDKL